MKELKDINESLLQEFHNGDLWSGYFLTNTTFVINEIIKRVDNKNITTKNIIKLSDYFRSSTYTCTFNLISEIFCSSFFPTLGYKIIETKEFNLIKGEKTSRIACLLENYITPEDSHRLQLLKTGAT